MVVQAAVRRFGRSDIPGISVVESPGVSAFSDPRYGTTFVTGVFKRGEEGVAIPINSRAEWDEMFGDPRDPNWSLFADGSHQAPDFVDGFFSRGGGSGQLWVNRLPLEGESRPAEVTVRNRMGTPAVKFIAANGGRWGGAEKSVSSRPIVVATSRTFTLVAPDVLSNEYAESIATFASVPGKQYLVVSNTAPDPASGEVVFTVAPQFNLLVDGISGPSVLTGTNNFSRYSGLTGTVDFTPTRSLAGTATLNGSVVTGTGTAFTTDISVGDNLYYQGETKVILSITSDTTLTVDSPFTDDGATGVTLSTDNTTLTGTTTLFTAELSVGDTVYADINGDLEPRTVEEIPDDTTLRVSSGFSSALAGATLQTDNLTVVGTGTSFTTEVEVGDYITDPFRSGDTVEVTAITSDTEIEISSPFSADFTGSQLTKQNQTAALEISEAPDTGLTVEISQGTRFPDTHFSATFYFNGSRVLGPIPDLSLDPASPEFVEDVVSNLNIGYSTGTKDVVKYVRAEVLWQGSYTTNPETDVRPANGSGLVAAVDDSRVYTISDNIDYDLAVDNLIYPSPYTLARSYYRVVSSMAPLSLSGTVNSVGNTVNGTATIFTDEVSVGDYLYSPQTQEARKVIGISSDTELRVESAFSEDIDPGTTITRAGYLDVGPAYDMATATEIGIPFILSYPMKFKGGHDGDIGSLIPFHFTRFFDRDTNFLENATFGKNLGLIKIAIPGVSDIAVQKAAAAYAEAKAYEFRGEVPSLYTSAAAAESFINNEVGRNDFAIYAFPSYIYISSPLRQGQRLISASGDILGGEAKLAADVQGYHYQFAGARASLPRALKLPYEPTPADEAILNATGLQPLKRVSGNISVFGVRTASRSDMYRFCHIRRIQSNLIRVFLESTTMMEALFLPNQPGLASHVEMTLENFARREYKKGVFTNYLNYIQAVNISNLNQTSSGGQLIDDDTGRDAIVEIVNGKLNIKFSYIPTGVLEKLTIYTGPDVLVAEFGDSINR